MTWNRDFAGLSRQNYTEIVRSFLATHEERFEIAGAAAHPGTDCLALINM
jgi:hypothetical protein